jgi:hypothetical protein
LVTAVATCGSAYIAHPLRGMAAALFRLAAELSELKRDCSPAIPPTSEAARELVLDVMRQAIVAAGGEAELSIVKIASSTGLHQTYVSAIVRALLRDGALLASGKRNRRYRLA